LLNSTEQITLIA